MIFLFMVWFCMEAGGFVFKGLGGDSLKGIAGLPGKKFILFAIMGLT